MFIQPLEDRKNHINAKYCNCYLQLLCCNCSNKSFSAGGCIVVILDTVFMSTGGTEGGSKSQGTACGRAELREAVLPAANICEGLLKQNK